MLTIDSCGIHVNIGNGLGSDFARIGVSCDGGQPDRQPQTDRQTNRQTDRYAITRLEAQFYKLRIDVRAVLLLFLLLFSH